MDNRRFRTAVDDYGDMVYRIALNQTRSGADADDVVQAVFLKFYEKPPAWFVGSFDGSEIPAGEAGEGRCAAAEPDIDASGIGGARLRAWFIRVTVNECKSMWRAVWRRRVVLREIGDADTPPYEEPAFSDSAHEQLYAALGALPEKCRIVVHLFYFEEMSTRDISEVLGIKEPTVRTRLVRARKLLKQTLKEAWDDEQCPQLQSHDGRGPCLC